MAISTIGTDALAASAVTSTKLASGVPSRSQLPAGTVLQVVNATFSAGGSTTTSDTWFNTSLTATITPSSTSSKILVLTSEELGGDIDGDGSTITGSYRVLRNGSQIIAYSANGIVITRGGQNRNCHTGVNYLDSPASTSALTYTTQYLRDSGGSTAGRSMFYNQNGFASITLMEIAG